MEPLFSILTVCFNSEKTIKRTIESVLNQTFSNFEYIIIDGKSSDLTLKIIASFEQKFIEKGISYKWVSEPDKGIYDAMNKGIEASSGELIGIINSDDWYMLDALENIKNQFIRTKADFIHGNMNTYTSDNIFLKTLTPKSKKTAIRKMPFFHPTSFIHKRVYNQLKGYSLRYKICADYDFIIKIINNNFKISYLNKIITNFTIGGVSTRQVEAPLKESHLIRVHNGYSKVISKFYYFIETLICKIRYR
ncbi:MAG: glycosyltransferase family 2 protein [Polaribacter sp.]|uniref:glycosyltransferase family 2 protein n=1 Tax=Polaribacter sp. TaxID=1920175 RepID=UPI002F350377